MKEKTQPHLSLRKLINFTWYCKYDIGNFFFTNQFYFSLQELGLLFPVPPGGHFQGPLPEDGGVGGV